MIGKENKSLIVPKSEDRRRYREITTRPENWIDEQHNLPSEATTGRLADFQLFSSFITC
jgi:hypothetical protein